MHPDGTTATPAVPEELADMVAVLDALAGKAVGLRLDQIASACGWGSGLAGQTRADVAVLRAYHEGYLYQRHSDAGCSLWALVEAWPLEPAAATEVPR